MRCAVNDDDRPPFWLRVFHMEPIGPEWNSPERYTRGSTPRQGPHHQLLAGGSMKTVWKFDVPLDDRWHLLQLPAPAKVVQVATLKPGTVNLWVEVTPDSGDIFEQRFRVYGTGQPIPNERVYVGTAFDSPFVWHVYAEAAA